MKSVSRTLQILLMLIGAMPAVADSPNILLIVSEDNGPELGCYGDPYVQTPVLDRLAKEGVRFENAFVPYSVCSPSRACFLTGLYPHQNGQIGLATHKFAMYRNWPNLFTVLNEAGYRTGLLGKLHVNPESAFPVDYRAIRSSNFGKRDMSSYAKAAGEFFSEESDEPFFLSINYPDAHYPLHRQQFGSPEKPLNGEDVEPLPWIGADSPRLREFTANYYNCMRRLDDGVGLLLKELDKAGKSDNTLIVYIGDHGAQFSRGKCSVYEAGLRIPFIVHWKGRIKAGQVRDELTSTLDIMPTFCAAAKVKSPSGLPGLDLTPLLEDSPVDSWREHIFGFTTGAAPRIFHLQHSVRDVRWKLISNPADGVENFSARAYLEGFKSHYAGGTRADEIASAPKFVQSAYERFLNPPRWELYDLKEDPYEWNNLAEDPEHAAARDRLIAVLENWQKKNRDPFANQEWLEEFAEHQLKMQDLSYRGKANFKWPYLEKFERYVYPEED